MCPAKSKAQQRLFGIARAVQKGDRPASSVSDPAKMIAKKVKKREVDKFASTPSKNLPDRVKKEIKEAIRELIDEILNEAKGKFSTGFQCLECGKKFPKPVRKCSRCGSTDIDIATESTQPSQLAKLQEKLGRELTTPEKHQLSIAYKTLKMPDAMGGVMGGMTKSQAKAEIE